MLKLIVLNGSLQGQDFNLVEGLTIGCHENNTIKINSSVSIEAQCDSFGNFILISKNKKSEIDLGGELLSKLEVLPGLIFSLGDVGFSIQEEDLLDSSDKLETFKFQDFLNTNFTPSDRVYALKKPIKIHFVRGALLNSKIQIHWHPYRIGAKSTLHHFIDGNINVHDDIMSFEKSIESESSDILIRPFISNFISINKKLISKPTIVTNGDLVEFSETAFYIHI